MKSCYLFLASILLMSACSNDGVDLEQEVVGSWKLERIYVEGADCQTIYGADAQTEYIANNEGCATPIDILGNARRCINLILNEDGTGTFLWSEFSSAEDAPITYNIENNEIEYCFEQFSCSGFFELVEGKLQSTSELRFDQSCTITYVLSK